MSERYKLLKDLPNAKAGEIFKRIADEGALFFEDSMELLYSGEEIAKYDILNRDKGWFEKIEEKKYGGRVPKEGDEYWFILSDGTICRETWTDGEWSMGKFESGNAFWTREETEKELKRRKAYVILKEDTNGFVPSWKDDNEQKHFVSYDWRCKVLAVDCCWRLDRGTGLYFATEEDTEASIKAHRQQWLDYLDIEEKE